MTRITSMLLGAVRLLSAAALVAVAAVWRWPLWLTLRPYLLLAIVGGAALLLAAELCARQRPARLARAVRVATALLALAAPLLALTTELRFRLLRREVLAAEPERLARLGRHVVVGYRDLEEARQLVGRGAVAGVFVTHWNAGGRPAEALAAEIAALQAARPAGAPALWIAADQEGGVVSRLSPPLPLQPGLASLAGACAADAPACTAAVKAFAAAQARGLVGLGVNLDLAPVVDLDSGSAVPGDRFSRIHDRAISADPAVVARVADAYCAGLAEAGVGCALKHFPGLGRLRVDTHYQSGTLTAPAAELSRRDWLPFDTARFHPARFTMIGHAVLAAVDPERPASLSPGVIRDLLRTTRGVGGPLVTDDLCMRAALRGKGGLGQGAVQALNAGMDLLLVSYDPDQYYPVMAALLRADRQGRIDRGALEQSDARLERARRSLHPAQ